MIEEIFNLKNKTAVITGASRGLGKAMAIGLAKSGANIVVTDILDTEETVEQLKQYTDKAMGLTVDVTKKANIEKMVKETINQFGSIDILVNNAGILKTDNAEDFDEKDWKQVIDVNLTGQFLCAQAVGKQMINQQSGKIINISSIAGLSGYASSAPYSASKAGVISLTKTLAAEWGKHHVTVNAICPGVFATEMTDDYLKDEQFQQMIQSNVPLGRFAEPKELIGTIIYLSSPASDYMTGHALVIDGGWVAGV